MAGDWIPVSVDLPGKPEVAMLSRILGKSTDECIGMLIRFWIWCQAHTDDGNLSGMDTAMISAVSHVPERFFGALQQVGWLEVTESGCIIPNFERWFGGAAKRRLLEARKKRLQRAAQQGGERNACPDLVPILSRSCPDVVPMLSRAQRDKNGTRGEESRGENKNNSSPPIKGPPLLLHDNRDPPLLSPDGDSSPTGDDARVDPDRDAFEEWWRHYPRKVGKQAAFRAYVNARKRICKERKCAPSEARSLLLQACIAFSQSAKARSEFCPHPGTWLNQGRYDDDPAEWDRVSNEQAAESLEEVLRKAMSDG